MSLKLLGNPFRTVSASVALAIGLKAFSLFGQTNCTAPPAGLVGWWKGDTNANDSVGGNNGTVQNGAGYAAGEVLQAFEFNGVNQFVAIPDAPVLDPTNSLTVEAWAYLSGPPSQDVATIVTKQGTVNPSDIQYQLQSYNVATGITFRCTVYLPTGYAWVNGKTLVQSNTWYHVAMTYNNTNLVLYVNGAQDGSVAATGAIAPTAEPLRIGGAGSGSWFFNGRVDEVSLYDRALSASEIQAIYNAGAGGKCAVPPTILVQPSDRTVTVGNSVSFTVEAGGSAPLTYQWEKDGSPLSGATAAMLNLQNVQLGDAGAYSAIVSNAAGMVTSSNATLTVNNLPLCQPAPAGLVSWWQADSNAQDITGLNNGSLVGGASFTNGEVGTGFSFNGAGQFVEIPDSPSLRFSNELTVELWYKDTGTTAGHYYGLLAKRGPYPSGCNYGIDMLTGPSGVLQVYIQDPNYGGYLASDSPVPTPGTFHHVAATYRQAAAEQVELRTYIDGQLVQTGMVSGNLARTLNNAPVTIGADDPNETYFVGIIDEPTIYSRALSATEIQTIYNAGAAGKCVLPFAPTIVTQPINQSVLVGNGTSFSVVAGGSSPLSYQWEKNGGPLSGATTDTLSLTNVQLSDAGSYSVVITNVVGAVTSAPAVLTVALPPASIQVGAATVAEDGTVTVPINLLANGNENSLGFSLNFDPTLLTNTGVVLGSGATGASLFPNLTHASAGQMGVLVGLSSGATFAAGTQQIAVASFTSPIVTSATSTAITYGDSPVKRVLADALGNPLAATFNSGSVLLPATQLEADAYPRPNGDEALTVSDWVLIGRYVAGLDSPTNALEFQKADCAPRDTLGDGQLTVSDWVQAGRYVAGLDPLTRAGGPTAPIPFVVPATAGGAVARRTEASARQVRLTAPALLPRQTGTVQVQLEAQGNENALAFSLSFKPAELTYLGANVGAAANGVILNVNDRQVTQGRLGLVLALQANQSFAAGTKELVNVSFRATPTAGGNSPIAFSDQPVPREVADPVATVLAADYFNASVTVSPLPSLRITNSGQSISLSWPTSPTGFSLQVSSDSRTWTAVTASATVANNQNLVSVPAGASPRFYRLYHP